MDLTFLFWNTNSKKCLEEINNLVNKYSIDVLILAENPCSQSEILLLLNKDNNLFFPQHPYSQCKKIKIYTRFHYDFIEPIEESNRFTARRLNLPTLKSLNLIALHLGDKGSFNSESQSEMASLLKDTIDGIEIRECHERTVVVGDFNMNPFEIGLVKANGLHATMSQSVAKKEQRTVQGKDYKYFYNPMWSLFGDLSDDVSGTYYYKKAELVNYHWNIFDQVLLRPVLIDKFDKQSLRILSDDGVKKLVNKNGIPNRQLYSDHLPIKFIIKA
jgi:exonuclease III